MLSFHPSIPVPPNPNLLPSVEPRMRSSYILRGKITLLAGSWIQWYICFTQRKKPSLAQGMQHLELPYLEGERGTCLCRSVNAVTFALIRESRAHVVKSCVSQG